MKKSEAVEKIKEICNSYTTENDCSFFSKEYNECIFTVEGLEIPVAWRADDE